MLNLQLLVGVPLMQNVENNKSQSDHRRNRNFLNNNKHVFSHAIVAVGIENLYKVSKLLLNANINNILIEKPGALFKHEFDELVMLSNNKKSNVYIAYNRRFLASVIKAKKLSKKTMELRHLILNLLSGLTK